MEGATHQAVSDFDVIVEFGGGYGSLCRVARRLGFAGTYVIHDLLPFSVLQRLYLQMLRWPTAPLDAPKANRGMTYLATAPEITAAWIDHVLPTARGLLMGTWSLSEAPMEVRQPFISRLDKFQAVLVAYQRVSDGIDDVAYFEDVQKSHKHWSFVSRSIPGMDEDTGRYLI